jgi:hypothetical protein
VDVHAHRPFRRLGGELGSFDMRDNSDEALETLRLRLMRSTAGEHVAAIAVRDTTMSVVSHENLWPHGERGATRAELHDCPLARAETLDRTHDPAAP